MHSIPVGFELLTWNVAGRVARAAEQADLVVRAGADVVCLQELRPASAATWVELLALAGYEVSVAEMPAVRESSRPLGVLTAARSSLRVAPVADVPWPERVLAVRLEDGLEVVNVHSPISPKPGLAKVLTHGRCSGTWWTAPATRGWCAGTSTPRGANTPTGACGRSREPGPGCCERSAASAGMRPRAR